MQIRTHRLFEHLPSWNSLSTKSFFFFIYRDELTLNLAQSSHYISRIRREKLGSAELREGKVLSLGVQCSPQCLSFRRGPNLRQQAISSAAKLTLFGTWACHAICPGNRNVSNTVKSFQKPYCSIKSNGSTPRMFYRTTTAGEHLEAPLEAHAKSNKPPRLEDEMLAFWNTRKSLIGAFCLSALGNNSNPWLLETNENTH